MVSICQKFWKLAFGLLTHKDNRISKVSSQKGIFHFEEHPNQHHIPGSILICNRKNIWCRSQVYQSPIASDCCNRSLDLDWSSLSQYAPPVAKPQLPSGLTATKGPLPLPHPYLVLCVPSSVWKFRTNINTYFSGHCPRSPFPTISFRPPPPPP